MRRTLLFAPATLLLAPRRAAAMAERYALNPRVSTIAFSVSHLGMFASQGEFRRFSATLDIDQAHPERTRVVADVDAASLDMAWAEAGDMLRSAEFFDVRRFPRVQFTSTAVVPMDADRYRVTGVMQLRGVSRPVALEAKLTYRGPSAADGGIEVADFVITGVLHRSEFGMTADRVFISDAVRITINARIEAADPHHAG